jgi:hypothetical protein
MAPGQRATYYRSPTPIVVGRSHLNWPIHPAHSTLL